MSEHCPQPQAHPARCGCEEVENHLERQVDIERINYSALQGKLATAERNAAYWKEQYQALRNDYQRTVSEKVGLSAELEAARGLLWRVFDEAEHATTDMGNPLLDHQLRDECRAFLTATPAPEVQSEQEKCDRDLELFGVSFSVLGRRVDPADVVWRMKHADVGPEVSRYDDFRGDNKWLVSSASSLLALDEKGALTGGGIGGHARTIIASLAARLMQQEDRQQSSQAEQGERQEAVARVGMVPGTDVRALVEALEVSVDYLDSNSLNSIASGSTCHRKMRNALAAHRQAQP